jgi:hypothetical protein
MAVSDDVDVYFVGFGESADLNGETIQIIFSNYHEPLLMGMAEGRRITATAKTSDVSSVSMGDLIVIRDANYKITETELGKPDGRFTKLILEEA